MSNNPALKIKAPGLIKLGACFIYEFIIIIAISFATASIFIWLFGDATHGIKRYLFQIFLWLSVGLYFVWCWCKSGQTVAMKTWKLKLVSNSLQKVSINQAVARYVLASISLVVFGLGFIWALFDRDKLFLHDRLLKTKFILS